MSRFTLSRIFFCVPAKRQHSVMMNAINAVIVGKRLLRSIMVGDLSMLRLRLLSNTEWAMCRDVGSSRLESEKCLDANRALTKSVQSRNLSSKTRISTCTSQ